MKKRKAKRVKKTKNLILNKKYLFTEISESQFKDFKKIKTFSHNELKILQGIAEIKRKENSFKKYF